MPSKKRCALLILAAAVLVASALTCNVSTRMSTLPPPPNTVTPYIPVTSPPQDATSPPAPTEESSEPTAPPESPTETATPTESATDTPEPTKAPTKPVSEGPLDFEVPRWVHAWAPAEGGVVLTVTIKIIGGAPPFTVKHEGDVVGVTMERQFYFSFRWSGCGGIAKNITVESADGDTKTHDYWLGPEVLPWCP
jgi:hypothetical protein